MSHSASLNLFPHLQHENDNTNLTAWVGGRGTWDEEWDARGQAHAVIL